VSGGKDIVTKTKKVFQHGKKSKKEIEERKNQMKKKLDNREKRFIQEYLIDLNVERAAVAAGYSRTMARTKAYSWVCNSKVKPHIYLAIERAMKKREERTEITQDQVLKEIALLAFSKLPDFVKWGKKGVEIKDLNELTEEQAACVSEVQDLITKDNKNIKFKLHSKEKALEMLCRHLGMFNDKLELSGDIIVETGIRRPFDSVSEVKQLKGA